MARNVRLRELLVGVEGLALLRHLYDGADEDADTRLGEVRRLLDDPAFAAGEVTTEADVRTGYDAWADRYDEPGNQVVALEQTVVWDLLDKLPPGRALDAACGTGRHAGHLAELGHQVVGVDLSHGMLQRATASVPAASVAQADLRRVPLRSEAFDLAVSGLAIAHVMDLAPVVAELARVLRPGGHLVTSVLHPFQALLGWHAPFQDAEGRRGFVREHDHTHADYLAAFRSAGLVVEECVEPTIHDDLVQAKRRAFRHVPEATRAAYLGLPAVLVWHAVKP
jgi:SAM-dependent methyltransferase